MSNLKRLWDTEGKKMVRAIPTGDPHKKLQVWTNDDGSKLYVYDIAGWREIAQSTVDAETYGPVWKQLEDETVGYYLTNVSTDLFNWDSGDEVSYRFMNGTTVLQSGTIDEGETPEYTGDTPTKASTAQYSYTFSGWKPAVGPITKKTDFKAQFTSTVNEYTVSIASNDIDYGTVDEASVENVPYGTAISEDENVLTIGETDVTATPETGYVFVDWGELPATVTGNLSITATFEAAPEPLTIEFQDYEEDPADGIMQFYPEQEGEEDPITGYYGTAYFTYNGDLENLSLDLVETAEGLSGVTFTPVFTATETEGEYYVTVSTDDTEHVGALGYGDYVCKFNVVWSDENDVETTIGTLTVNIDEGP